MRFPIYWKRVQNKQGTLFARGWSDRNPEEAQQHAEMRLARIESALQKGDSLDRYHYVIDKVICEFVVDRVLDKNDTEIAVISRNAYGSLVLNAPSVMFIDIDTPRPKSVGLFKRLFGKPEKPIAPESERLEMLRVWQSHHADFAFRVYRTRAGLRAMVTNRIFQNIDQSVLDIMDELDGDPLYRQQCKSQHCFRARLTPKPWRIGIPTIPPRFPIDTVTLDKEFSIWFDNYLTKSKQFCVCHWI